MQITYPLGLLGLLAIIPIIWWHRTRPSAARRVTVPTVMFWQQLAKTSAATTRPAPRREISNWRSLLFQLAVIAALVAAICQPRWVSSATVGTTAILIDNSLSMTAGPRTRSPLMQARQLAKRMVRQSSGRCCLLTADRSAPVLMGLTSDRSSLLAAIDALQVTHDAALESSVDLARRILDGQNDPRVIVLTDTTAGGAGAIAAQEGLSVQAFALSATDNVAITRLATRRTMVDPTTFELLVEVVNYAQREFDFELEIGLDETLIDVIPVRLAAGESWQEVRGYPSATGGTLTCRAKVADALALDNAGHLTLEAAPTVPVMLVGPSHYFLEQAFGAIPNVDLQIVERLPDELPRGTLAVFHRDVPPQLPACHLLIVDPRSDFAGVRVGPLLEENLVVRQLRDHLLMAWVDLEGLMFLGARQLEFTSPPRILAENRSGEPLYAAIQHPDSLQLVLTTNLDECELPFQSAFPILINNIVAAARTYPDSPRMPSAIAIVTPGSSQESQLQPSHASGVGVELPSRRGQLFPILVSLAALALVVEWIDHRANWRAG